jgi:asparagine synthase (glutamine-hydrolysing)
MCGIVGCLSSPPIDLHLALDCIAHRGPDDDGLYIGNGVALGVRRLSIIDLAGGHQPLSNEDGSVWIAYNGEVFNAPELRCELETAGHLFKTHTDTETIVHAYEQWGADAIARLRGMFALAIWDAHHDRLVLARDRFGIKPLHYAESGGRFAFGSETRSIFATLPDLTPCLNQTALRYLFEIGFSPSPLTAFDQVYQLPAAHILIREKNQTTIKPYWQLTYPSIDHHRKIDLHEAAQEFVKQLHDAVDAWRMSDVPVGSLLSGGVDSASLAALLTEISGGQIHTFTIGFTAASHDESALARETARFLGSHHHELTFSAHDFDYLPNVVRHLEQPQCSATSVPIYLLYRACHEAGFKVIMTGEGADELLGGYHWFDGDRRARKFLRWPHFVRNLIASAPLPASEAARHVIAHGSIDPIERYALWQQVADARQTSNLFKEQFAPSISVIDHWRDQFTARLANTDPLDQFLLLEAQTRLIDFINFEVDRMSMASSIEARPPFLDHRLWEFCASLPPDCKLSPNGNKLLLRLGLRDRLPANVLNQPKRGLATPHADWWRADRLPTWAEACLNQAAIDETGYFNFEEVNRLRKLHQSGRANVSRLLMGVLTTQLWHNEFVG